MRQHLVHVSSFVQAENETENVGDRQSNRRRLNACISDRSIDLAKPRSIQFTPSSFARWLILDTVGALTRNDGDGAGQCALEDEVCGPDVLR